MPDDGNSERFFPLFLSVGLHLPGLIDAWRAEPTMPEYLADPSVFWLVKLMDLGIVVPGMVGVGVGVLRQTRWAQKLTYAAVGGWRRSAPPLRGWPC